MTRKVHGQSYAIEGWRLNQVLDMAARLRRGDGLDEDERRAMAQVLDSVVCHASPCADHA